MQITAWYRTICCFVATTVMLLVGPGDAAYEIRSLAQERTLNLLKADSFYAQNDVSGEAFMEVCQSFLAGCRVRIDQADPTVVGLMVDVVDSTGTLAVTMQDFFHSWTDGKAALVDIGPVLAVLLTELEMGQIMGVLTDGDSSNEASVTEVLSVLLGGLLGRAGEPIASLIDYFLGVAFEDNEQKIVEAGYVTENGGVRQDIIDSLLGSMDLAQLDLSNIVSQLVGLFTDDGGTADIIVTVVRVFVDVLGILIPSGSASRRRELFERIATSERLGARGLKRNEKSEIDDDEDDGYYKHGKEEKAKTKDLSRTSTNSVKANATVHQLLPVGEESQSDNEPSPTVNSINEDTHLYVNDESETDDDGTDDDWTDDDDDDVQQDNGRSETTGGRSGPASWSDLNSTTVYSASVAEANDDETLDNTSTPPPFPDRGSDITAGADTTNSTNSTSTTNPTNSTLTAPFGRLGEIFASMRPRETVRVPHKGLYLEISSLDENMMFLNHEVGTFFDTLRAAAIAERDGGIFAADTNDPEVRADVLNQFTNLLNLDLIVTIIGGLSNLLGTLGGQSDPQGPFAYLASFIALAGEVLGQGAASPIFFTLSGLLQMITSLSVFQGTYHYMEATFPRAFPDSIQPELQRAAGMIDVELSEILMMLQTLANSTDVVDTAMASELDCRLELLACETSETVLQA